VDEVEIGRDETTRALTKENPLILTTCMFEGSLDHKTRYAR
jgi:hypothetical protein